MMEHFWRLVFQCIWQLQYRFWLFEEKFILCADTYGVTYFFPSAKLNMHNVSVLYYKQQQKKPEKNSHRLFIFRGRKLHQLNVGLL